MPEPSRRVTDIMPPQRSAESAPVVPAAPAATVVAAQTQLPPPPAAQSPMAAPIANPAPKRSRKRLVFTFIALILLAAAIAAGVIWYAYIRT